MSQFTQGIATSREYIDHVDVMNQGRSWEGVKGLDEHLISQHTASASVLVAYATLYSSTQEAAEAVATALRKCGLEVGIRLMRVNFGRITFPITHSIRSVRAWMSLMSEPLTPSGSLSTESGERLLTFPEDGQGQATHLFWGPLAYSKASPYQTLGFQVPLLAACIVLFVSVLITFPAAYFVRRWRGSGGAPSRTARVARWLAAVVSALNLFLLACFLISLLEFAETYVWPSQTVLTITRLWLLSVPLTLSIVVLAVLAWKDRYWSTTSRAHYTLVALAAVLFVLFLSNWNLIGF